MGRTVMPFSYMLEAERERWKGFRRSLDRPEKGSRSWLRLDPDEKMNAISRVLVFLLPEYVFEASNFGIFSKPLTFQSHFYTIRPDFRSEAEYPSLSHEEDRNPIRAPRKISLMIWKLNVTIFPVPQNFSPSCIYVRTHCPCGSGKKFKKGCGMIQGNEGISRQSPRDRSVRAQN